MLEMKRCKTRSLPATISNLVTRQSPTQLPITQGKGSDDMEALRKQRMLTGQLSQPWQDTWSGIWAGSWKKRKRKKKGCSGSRNKGYHNREPWTSHTGMASAPAQPSGGVQEGVRPERSIAGDKMTKGVSLAQELSKAVKACQRILSRDVIESHPTPPPPPPA